MNSYQIATAEQPYFSDATIFANSASLTRAFVMQDYEIGMHAQEFFEINIITRGHGIHYIEHNLLPAECGDVFILPPNIQHGYTGGAGFNVAHLLISNQFMKKYLSELQTLPAFYLLFNAEPLIRQTNKQPLFLSLSGEDFEKTKTIFQQINQLTEIHSAATFIQSNALSIILISILCSSYAEQFNTTDILKEDEAFMQALAFIHERFDEKINISTLASIAKLSRSSFIRRFHEVCHMPPATYLRKVRIDAAAHMLTNTNLSISEIALRVGFYDTSHFVRSFIRDKNCSPNQYRKKVDVLC